MVQFQVVSGKMAGRVIPARHFPFRIGRAPTAHLCVEEAGVWAEHLVLHLIDGEGFVLTVTAPATANLNGQPFQEGRARNGDLIELGALQLRFWIGAPRQAALIWREALVWTSILLVTATQVYLVYRLLR